MEPELYYAKKTGERLGVVLAKYESESSPGKYYQVRTADSDGCTYCTCRGWVQALQVAHRRGRGEEAICWHITDYRQRPEAKAKPIVIMDFESFTKVKRGIPLKLNNKTVDETIHVRRS